MLDREHAGGERRLVIVRPHRHGALRNDRTHIDVRRDVMNAASVNAHAVGECAAMRVQARIERQQRRMNVDDATGIVLDEIVAKHAHESGMHDQIRLGMRDLDSERVVKRVARAVTEMVDDRCRNAGSIRQCKPRRVGTIADHLRHRPVDVSRTRMCDQRAEIRAAPGDQNGDTQQRHRASACGPGDSEAVKRSIFWIRR